MPSNNQPSSDYATNAMYMQQSAPRAQLNPGDAQAQRQAQYWAEVVQRQAEAIQMTQLQSVLGGVGVGAPPLLRLEPYGQRHVRLSQPRPPS